MAVIETSPARTGSYLLAMALALGCLAANPAARAQDSVEIAVTVKDHKFDPAELQAPAGKPIVLRIKNLDATPMEFESKTLRVEKVLTGNSEAVVNVRAQKPGRYEFFDEFHEKTTRGVLVVK
jgi:plastocyanin